MATAGKTVNDNMNENSESEVQTCNTTVEAVQALLGMFFFSSLKNILYSVMKYKFRFFLILNFSLFIQNNLFITSYLFRNS